MEHYFLNPALRGLNEGVPEVIKLRVRDAALLGTAGGLRRCTGGGGGARRGDAVRARGVGVRELSVRSIADAAAGERRMFEDSDREDI